MFISEVQELETNLPSTCKTSFPNPNELHKLEIVITPDEGFWYGGKFKFLIEVPDDYNMVVRLLSFFFFSLFWLRS